MKNPRVLFYKYLCFYDFVIVEKKWKENEQENRKNWTIVKMLYVCFFFFFLVKYEKQFMISEQKQKIRPTTKPSKSSNNFYSGLSMATLSHSSLHFVRSLPPPSSFSSSTSTIRFSVLTQIPSHPVEIPLYSVACSTKLQLIRPTQIPILLLNGFDNIPLDTQTFIVTISVLVAISLSLFLGLKVEQLFYVNLLMGQILF